MSHPEATINGCSLEDCNTNLFALTDLGGIKWRKYVGGENSMVGDARDDHVLGSYTRCIRHDILCVWRRAQKNNDHLACRKELWIFWYGEEPVSLSQLVSSHLKVDHPAEGSWEADGLTYECRTLLFKALHNLIERCLTQQGFVRVGKWFVQPFDLRHANDKGTNLSMRFNFFLHGESTVCGTIDVRIHTGLWRLQAYHLAHAANNTHNGQMPVLLAPYGMAATISGHTYKDSEPASQRFMQDWLEFFAMTPEPPIPSSMAGGPHSAGVTTQRCAKVVEVMVGGARMKYPSALVMVPSDIQQEMLRQNHGSLPPTSPPAPTLSVRLPNTPPMSPTKVRPAPPPEPEPKIKIMAKAAYMDATYEPLMPHATHVLTTHILDRMWLDSSVTTGTNGHAATAAAAAAAASPSASSSNNNNAGSNPPDDQQFTATVGVWEFGEPTQKNSCACNKQKSHKRPGSSNQSKSQGTTGKRDKNDTRRIPYHRRLALMMEQALHQEMDLITQQPATRAGSQKAIMPANQQAPNSVPPAAATTTTTSSSTTSNSGCTTSSSSGTTPTNTTPSSSGQGSAPEQPSQNNNTAASAVDSPHSAAPSPLVAPQLPPSSSGGVTQNGDHATMPTLSPHPPPLIQQGGGATTPKDSAAAAAAGQGKTEVIVLDGENNNTTAAGTEHHQDPTATVAAALQAKQQPSFCTAHTPAQVHIKSESTNTWFISQQMQRRKALKRPHLPTKDYDDDEEEDDMKKEFNNFSGLRAWLEHPVKKQKYEDKYDKQVLRSQRPSSRGYRGDQSPRGNGHANSNEGGGADPFEFSDESSASNLFKRNYMRREENGIGGDDDDDDDDCYPLDSPSGAGGGAGGGGGTGSQERGGGGGGGGAGFMLNESELRPSMADLNNIFDTSDSESNGPGGMSGLGGNLSDTESRTGEMMFSALNSPKIHGRMSPPKNSHPNTGGAALSELQRMYPTPPSTENNHNAASPCNGIIEMPGGMLGGPDPDLTILTVIPAPAASKAETLCRPRSLEEQGVTDWSYVYKPPPHVVYETSSKYAAIALPSASEQPLPTSFIYRPSWLVDNIHRSQQPQPQHHHHHHQQQQLTRAPTHPAATNVPAVMGPVPAISTPQHQHQHQQPHTPHSLSAGHYGNPRSVENVNSVGRPGAGASSPYPPGSLSQQRTPRTPLSYELQSPASNASSYMNKNINSVGGPTGSLEVNSLIVNIFLSDSMVNLFKDQNFDSCPICVCNTNLKGSDVGLYLTDRAAEAQYACTCGFSAVNNRKYGAAGSGLFYEDEVDITGLRDDRLEQRKPSLLTALKETPPPGSDAEKQVANLERIPVDVMTQLQVQFSSIFPSLTTSASLASAVALSNNASNLETVRNCGLSMLEKQDSCEACWMALEMGRQAIDHGLSPKLDDSQKKNCMHHWPLQRTAPVPNNSQDVVRLLKSLQPLLQDAIQKKRTTRVWDHVYTITLPLSWKDFHLLAGRGADETSEPQPIPALLAGSDHKDWLKTSPQSLRFWEKMNMEPYGQQQDVAYVIVAPDNDFILGHVRSFISDLSRQYEQCRLGKHRPFTTKMRDSTFRVGRSQAMNLAKQPVQDWFHAIKRSPTAAKLKLYAQVCRGYLAPFIARALVDEVAVIRATFADPVVSKVSRGGVGGGGSNFPSEPSPAPPQTPEGGTSGGEANDCASGNNGGASSSGGGHSSGTSTDLPVGGVGATDWFSSSTAPGGAAAAHLHATDMDDTELPALVIYLIDPFSGTSVDTETDRLAMLGLLRCYQSVLDHVDEEIARHKHDLKPPQRPNIQLQLIPLHKLMSISREEQGGTCGGVMKSLAFAVYSQCRRILTHTVVGKSMTGFGPVAAATKLLTKPTDQMTKELQLYTPPYIIAPVPENKLSTIGEAPQQERSRVLLCGYCLSEDQRCLLGVCTDSKGELIETCVINIEIPNRNRRKKASARRMGLSKLWDFIMSIVSRNCHPWRLVIGRFGRLGHGELKGWSSLLSSKHLAAYNRLMRDTCGQCSIGGRFECPLLLSACLISMETHSSIHIMPDSMKMQDEKNSSNIQMDTPRDATCTHILVVPTSAHAQTNGSGIGGMAGDDDVLGTGGDGDVEEDFLSGMIGGGEGMDDIDMMAGDIPDISDLLGGFMDHANDLNSSDHGQMHNQGCGGGGGQGSGGMGGPSMYNNRQTGGGNIQGVADPQDEVPNLQQQPLAMGFYTSTAGTGPLPKWFWAACPHRENVVPTCLKAALHVNSHSPNDFANMGGPPKPKISHPLESDFTTDVLRYVLETYNALSWLNIDPATNERRSCLPIHFAVLMQLYYATNTFV